MSALAGILRFDQQPVPPGTQTALLARLAHRGAATVQELPHGLLARFGPVAGQPVPGTYAVVLDADAITESELSDCLRSDYVPDDYSFLNTLTGDFALACWDETRRTLVLARDVVGTKPLYFTHQPGRFMAFATEIGALLALESVPSAPNEHHFYTYLTWPTDYVPYPTETFYEQIFSVLPGYSVHLSAHTVEHRSYWEITPGAVPWQAPPRAYADLFAEQFTQVIDRRMGGRYQPGAHLSGGLDSSAVSGVAQGLLRARQQDSLHTFSIDTGYPAADERAFYQAAAAHYQTRQHTVHPLPDVRRAVQDIHALFGQPEQFIIPSSFHLSVSERARQLGCDLLLTGHDGDSVIPTGFDYIDQLLDAGEWAELQQACRQYVSFPARNLFTINPQWPCLSSQAKYEAYVLSVVGAALKRLWKERPAGQFLGAAYGLKRQLSLPTAAILADAAQRVRQKLTRNVLIGSAFSAEFRGRVARRVVVSTAPLANQLSREHGIPVSQVLNATNVMSNEQLNHIGGHYGHDYSFPFFDKKLVELGLLTPLAVHFDGGRGRGLLRHGLAQVLPPAIVARLTKANFVEYGTEAAQSLYTAVFEDVKSADHPIWRVIDRPIFDQIAAVVFNPRYPALRKTRYNWLLSRTLYLALWLRPMP